MNDFEQGLLTYLSQNQLHKLQSCHIGIAGCGGLGSNTAIMLTRCGFKYFTIVDFDIIEASNLNRQQFTLVDIGKPKARTLAEKLRAINPDLSCNIFEKKWTPGLKKDPLLDCDILVEAFDWAENKTALIDYYCDRTQYIISGNGLAGVRGPTLTVQRRDNIFFVGDKLSEANTDHPPMAPRVTQCAAMMADIILDLVLRTEPACVEHDESSK